MLRCLWGEGYVAQCSAGADCGHNTRAQWSVILAAPCPGRYGVDATPCPVGHSAVSSRRPAEIAGVVDALMGRDALSGSMVKAEATGYCRVGLERYGESLSRSRLYAWGLGRDGELVPRRGLPCEASCEAESQWARTMLEVNRWFTFWLRL